MLPYYGSFQSSHSRRTPPTARLTITYTHLVLTTTISSTTTNITITRCSSGTGDVQSLHFDSLIPTATQFTCHSRRPFLSEATRCGFTETSLCQPSVPCGAAHQHPPPHDHNIAHETDELQFQHIKGSTGTCKSKEIVTTRLRTFSHPFKESRARNRPRIPTTRSFAFSPARRLTSRLIAN